MSDIPSENPARTQCCSFCGKSNSEVTKLIAGPGVFICDECIALCNDIVVPEDREARTSAYRATPAVIDSLIAAADRAIPGQQAAKRTLAAGLIEALLSTCDPQWDQGGRAILVLGPVGCGKRQALAEMIKALGLPHLKIDIPLLFPGSSFIGTYEPSNLYGLDGFVLLDHLNAILDPVLGAAARQLQYALVTVLDSTELRIMDRSDHRVNTSKAIFIGVCDLAGEQQAGDFEGAEGLVGMGFLPALAARFGTVVVFESPDHAAYASMLIGTGGLFEQCRNRLESGGRTVRFAVEAADPLATWAVRRNEGILGLRSLISRLCGEIVLDPHLGLDDEATLDAKWVRRVLAAAGDE